MKLNPLFPLILLFLSLSAMQSQAWAGGNDTIELTVVENDYLINICRKYLEDPRKWPEVGRVNRLKNYNLIRSGSRLVIPIRLLKGVPVDGVVVFLKGSAELKDGKGGSWKPLRQNDPVRQGNLVRTGQEGAVEIAFADGTGFFLRPGTSLDLLTSQMKGGSHLFQRFRLSTGRILTRVRSATGRDSRIEIPTPSATAVVRGTDFRLSVLAGDASTCEVMDGTVDVEALRQNVLVQGGEGTRVNRGKPPLKPRKLLPYPLPPPLQSPIRTMPYSIGFERIPGASAYRCILSRDTDGKDVVRERVVAANEDLALSGLDDGTYYLQMRSIDDIGLEGPSSPPQSVTVRLNPLPPFISKPVNGAKIKGKSLKVTWLKVRDAASYQLQAGPDKEFRQHPGDVKDTKDTGCEMDFTDYGNYYFRIRSVADDGYAGIWSDAVAVDMVPLPPPPDVNKPEGDGKELTIRWRSQGEKVTYHMQVAREESFREPLVDRKVDLPEATIPMPEEVGSYFVRVSAIDRDGDEGSYSSPQLFEVKRRLWPYAVGSLGVAGLLLLLLL